MSFREVLFATVVALGIPVPLNAAGVSDAVAVAPIAASSPPSSVIPFKVDKETSGGLSGRVLFALLACAVVGAGGIYLLRRRQFPRQSAAAGRRLELLEVKSLGVKASVVLLRWDHEELLIAHNDARTELLARRTKSSPNDDQAVTPKATP